MNDRPDITPARLRRLADRLCWLEHGDVGLRWRAGMLAADKDYWDKYDTRASRIAPEVLRVIKPYEPPGMKQMNLFGV